MGIGKKKQRKKQKNKNKTKTKTNIFHWEFSQITFFSWKGKEDMGIPKIFYGFFGTKMGIPSFLLFWLQKSGNSHFTIF